MSKFIDETLDGQWKAVIPQGTNGYYHVQKMEHTENSIYAYDICTTYGGETCHALQKAKLIALLPDMVKALRDITNPESNYSDIQVIAKSILERVDAIGKDIEQKEDNDEDAD